MSYPLFAKIKGRQFSSLLHMKPSDESNIPCWNNIGGFFESVVIPFFDEGILYIVNMYPSIVSIL
jgi:hypothetical protein